MKIKSAAKILVLFKNLRLENEKILLPKVVFKEPAPSLGDESNSPNNGEKNLSAIEAFNKIKFIDLANEYYPNILASPKASQKKMKRTRTTNF